MLISFGNDIPPKKSPVSAGERVSLPHGLLEFPEYKYFDLICMQQSWPYYFLSPVGVEGLRFIVIEPAGWIQNHQVDLPCPDAQWLDIYSPHDALVLNLVKVVSKAGCEQMEPCSRSSGRLFCVHGKGLSETAGDGRGAMVRGV